MEIDFNPSQLPVPRASAPVKAGPAPAAANDSPALQGMAELQRQLNDLALTRPDKMNAVRPLLSGGQYPPDELLNGIAHLLAIHFNQ